ncbi:metal-dependent hydrolase family protein [Sphingomonas sp. Root50]|nr:amidohydrolase family protein [Sphingomonas sp. Root50]
MAGAALLLAGAGQAQAQDRIVAIKAGRVIDTARGTVLTDQIIIVTGDRVTSIGPAASTTVPAGTPLIDLSGKTVLPGLIDTHTHITGDPTTSPYESYHLSVPRQTVTGVANARRTLLAGFTTIRDVGSSGYADVALRDGINAGEIAGPHILASGPALGITGGHCDDNHLAPEYHHEGEGVANGADAVRLAVRRNIKYGADHIKYCGTGGVFSRGDKPGAQQYTQEEANALVAEAHLHDRPVAVHAHGADGIKVAIRAGADSIEHASLIDEEGLKMAKAAGTVLSMDIYNTDYTQAEGKKNGVPEESLQKDRDVGDVQRENFRKAAKMGIKLSFGTDGGVYPNGDNARQFAVMVRYGMSPMQAIQAATVVGAALVRHPKDLGQVAPGFYADIIAVDGDPLTDVRALEKPAFVMKQGAVYRADGEQCGAAPSAWGCAAPAR